MTRIATPLWRGESTALALTEESFEVYLSVVSLGKLRAGFVGGSRSKENEAVFQRFLSRHATSVLLLDVTTTEFYARVQFAVRMQGTPIPTNDIWIAAQALQHDLMLDTRDSHFRHVPGLKLV